MPDQPILVAYASHTVSTEEVAEAIATALQEHSARVDMHPVQDVTALKSCRVGG
ncbi:hypothetical protein [Deinococcus psychrotolerans]|uniref:hypothetical protein n=1 Tax=Deinococcus psychrotolerans TaxID=2489213 RepID=UPI0013DE20E7|nr:hypothetical protein [Deinococcus psychrotolerans]